jgi:hypothetical protein
MRALPLIAAAAIIVGATAAEAAQYSGHSQWYGYDAYGYGAHGPYGAHASRRPYPSCRLARHESGAQAIQDRFYLESQGVNC